jgi:tetratricopeptide (TPR) repeat protein
MSTSPSKAKACEGGFILLGIGLVFLSLFGGWFDPATSSRLSAFQIGLWQGTSLPAAPFNLISYGTVGALFCLLAWRSVHRQNIRLLSMAMLVLFFLGIDCLIQIAISHPTWIESGLRGTADFQNTVNFANHYSIDTDYNVPPNYGVTVAPSTATLFDRLGAAYACLSYGWVWFTVASGACLFSIFWMTTDRGPLFSSLGSVYLVLGLILLVQISLPVIGQYDMWLGDRAAVADDLPNAEHHYQQAIALDEWYRLQPTAYLKIGALQSSEGDHTSPAACFYDGINLIDREFYLEGMDKLTQTSAADDRILAALVRQKIADLALVHAEAVYSKGAQGEACVELERALQNQPDQVAAYYMLGQAHADGFTMDQALDWYHKAEQQTQLPVLRAICLSAMGDCYYKMGQPAKARDYYLASSKMNENMNYRSEKSLIDDYYR